MIAGVRKKTGNVTADFRECWEDVSCKLLQGCVSGFEEGRHTILDLGPTNGATIDFFSRFHCRLTCWDISQSVAAQFADSDADEDEAWDAIQALFRIPITEPIDLLLSWELFNYIPSRLLEKLVPLLASMLSPGGAIHGISAAGLKLPLEPPAYKIVSDSGLIRQSPVSVGSQLGVLHQNRIQRLFTRFRLNRTILLRNGLYEYVLVRE